MSVDSSTVVSSTVVINGIDFVSSECSSRDERGACRSLRGLDREIDRLIDWKIDRKVLASSRLPSLVVFTISFEFVSIVFGEEKRKVRIERNQARGMCLDLRSASMGEATPSYSISWFRTGKYCRLHQQQHDVPVRWCWCGPNNELLFFRTANCEGRASLLEEAKIAK